MSTQQENDETKKQSYEAVVDELVQFTKNATNAKKTNTLEETYEIDLKEKCRFISRLVMINLIHLSYFGI